MYKHIEENFRSKSVFCRSVDFATVIAKWLTSVDSLQIAMETRTINKKCFTEILDFSRFIQVMISLHITPKRTKDSIILFC